MRTVTMGLIAGVLLAGLLAAPASAVVTASDVNTPAEGFVADPDTGDGNPDNVTVSGTAVANNGDLVDIFCVYNNGNDIASGGLQDVTVTGGAFSAQVDLEPTAFYSCRLIAVPDGAAPPFDLNTFSGPVLHISGYELFRVSGGPNDGDLYDYNQTSAALEGYWGVYSAGNCFVDDSFAMDPESLYYNTALFDCAYIHQDQDEPFLRFGDKNLVLPYEQTDFNPGFTQVTALQHSVDPQTGDLRVSDSETPAYCVPAGMNDCASYAGNAGVRLDQKQTGGTRGHTLAINHRWVNTTGQSKQLTVDYRVQVNGSPTGWRFPGESAYSGHAMDDTIAPGSVPASFFAAFAPASTCPAVGDDCGSVTWYRAPNSIVFISPDEVALRYTRTIPANGSRVLAFEFSQGTPQADVNGHAAAARSGFNTGFTVGKPRRNRTRGTARLPVDTPGAGKIAVSGKGIKPTSQTAGASASAIARSSAVTFLVKPKAKTRRKLNRRGRARVKVTVTYTRTGLDPVTKTVKLTLRKNLRRG